ncbi:MAG: alpha/beta hydrolase [Oscillospiraceae bacterium]|nr:alpha/beta hydrolase [Oscillospiraceae bacterium]
MYDDVRLGTLLSDERIAPIAPDAIRARDLSKEPLWDMTLSALRDEHIFMGDIGRGFARLYRAADTGSWYYPVYSEEERAADPTCADVNIVWLPSDDKAADDDPFILLIPGGGFVNVWSLTEGWPVADRFNAMGYHVFVLTYRVGCGLLTEQKGLLDRDMEDIAHALCFIRDNRDIFHTDADRYITCGFSAGGYLVCLWNTEIGHVRHELPKPQASFPIYPVTGIKCDMAGGLSEEEKIFVSNLCGMPPEEALTTAYETTEHVEHFPPCALFLAADDGLVSPDNSKALAKALEDAGIPCRLEIGKEGGHGFADGTGMCMEGWTERAIEWYESLT